MAGPKDLAQRLVSGSKSREQTDGEGSTMTRTKLSIEGMSCGHCEAAVEGGIGKLAGVEYSEADFEKGSVEVRYDAERVTVDDLRGAIGEAGYEVAD